MNIQNISALALQLQSLGFEDLGYLLLKRISFKPERFFLSQKVEKGKDQLNFHLFFERDCIHDEYILKYYDAVLQKEMALSNPTINGIEIAILEKNMSAIDWKVAFDFESKKQWNAADKASWEKEQKIESVVEELKILESTGDGKAFAAVLKLKFWAGISCQEPAGNTSPLKNKSDVIQRFYFFEEQAGISIDEAYRFLLNKWQERQIQAKRYQPDSTDDKENAISGDFTSDNQGILRKKRLNNSLKLKSKKKPFKI